MNTGLVAMAPLTNMPDDVKAMAEETIKKLTSGELKPFTGPLKSRMVLIGSKPVKPPMIKQSSA